MTRNRWMKDPKALEEAERFYNFVGKYVICFQWLEGQIDEIFMLSRGDKNWEETRDWLAQRTNAQKVDDFYDMIMAGETFDSVHIDGWYKRLLSVKDRLHAERRRRNGMLHAQFLFELLAIGAPILRTHVRRGRGNSTIDQEYLSPERCEQIMTEIAELAFDLNMICVQLRFVFNPREAL